MFDAEIALCLIALHTVERSLLGVSAIVASWFRFGRGRPDVPFTKHRVLVVLLCDKTRSLELWRSQKESAPAASSISAQNDADCCTDGQTSRLTPPALTARQRPLAVFSDWSKTGSLRLTANKGAPPSGTTQNEKPTSDQTSRSESRGKRICLPCGDPRRSAERFVHPADSRVWPRLAVGEAVGRG